MKVPCKKCLLFPICKARYDALIEVDELKTSTWENRVLSYISNECWLLKNFYLLFYFNYVPPTKINLSEISLVNPFQG